MDKLTCQDCLFYNPTDEDRIEGTCVKEPPKLSSIGVPTHPRITMDWPACGSHPKMVALAWKEIAQGIVPVIVQSYEQMMPFFDSMVVRMVDKVDKAEDKLELVSIPFPGNKDCPHDNKLAVEGRGWVCTDCNVQLTGS